jgi:hypothetical protein
MDCHAERSEASGLIKERFFAPHQLNYTTATKTCGAKEPSLINNWWGAQNDTHHLKNDEARVGE